MWFITRQISWHVSLASLELDVNEDVDHEIFVYIADFFHILVYSSCLECGAVH